jgi:hypothetical protein
MSCSIVSVGRYARPAIVPNDIPPDEVDPYKKPQELLQVSPKGLVPGLKIFKQGQVEFDPPRALNESTVIMEYIVRYAFHFCFSFCLSPNVHGQPCAGLHISYSLSTYSLYVSLHISAQR